MKRLLAILLILLMLAALLAACADDSVSLPAQTTDATTAADAVTEPAVETIPAIDALSTTLPAGIVKQLAPDAKVLNSTVKGKTVILTGQTSADAYIKAFTDAGYYDYPITRVEDAKYTVNFLLGKTYTVGIYFFSQAREVRIIWEDASQFDPAVLSPNEQTDTGVLKFAQVGVERLGEKDNPLNGMIQIAKLADGRAILIDGGSNNIKNIENIYRSLEKLEVVRDADGKMVIAAWVITHAHGDHLGAASSALKKYDNELAVENFIYNFCTDASVIGSALDTITPFIGTARQTCPDANHIVAHAGVKYYFGNATLSVLYTPELLYKNQVKLAYYNDSSLVFKLGVGETSVFVMGDAGNNACEVIRLNYAPEALQSSILQITHHGLYTEANSKHGWGMVKYVYQSVDADLAILPMHSKYSADARNGRFTVMGQWGENGHQISYVMNKRDKPFVGQITQELWDEFELKGTVEGKAVDTLYGYDGKNIVTNADGMVTYLGATYSTPMITVFDLDGKAASMAENSELYAWLG